MDDLKRGSPAKPPTAQPARLLMVDDDPAIVRAFRRPLLEAGHEVTAACNSAEAALALNRAAFDVCLLDLGLGAESGLELLPRLREWAPWMRVIVVTATNDVSVAIAAIRAGAADFLQKPCMPAELLHAVAQQTEAMRLERRIAELERDRDRAEWTPRTRSPAFRATLELAQRVAATDATVLILGENGTGKTQLARAVHGWSRRAAAPFATVSCPSLSAEMLASELFGHVRGAFTGAVDNRQGRVQLAEGGSLFMDEIGDMPVALQPKLLRFLQDREYERLGDAHTRSANVRVIAATNQDLAAMVADGRFREDLFYRLNVVTLALPALRERREDIPLLAEEELLALARRYDRPARRFSPAAMELLLAHPWPGNLRELHNAVERAVIVGDSAELRPEHLPLAGPRAPAGQGPRAGDAISLEELERAHIEAIVASSPSLEAAARLLRIDSSTLYRKRKHYQEAA